MPPRIIIDRERPEVVHIDDVNCIRQAAGQVAAAVDRAYDERRRALTIIVAFRCVNAPSTEEFNRFIRRVRAFIRSNEGTKRIRVTYQAMSRFR